MLDEWLHRQLGIDRVRAEHLAKSFASAGCKSVNELVQGQKKDWLQHLDTDLEEWEAIALADALNEPVIGANLVEYDPAFREEWLRYGAVANYLSAAEFNEMKADIIACQMKPSYSVLVCVKILHSNLHISYELLGEFLQTLAMACHDSTINQHMCLTTWQDLFEASQAIFDAGNGRNGDNDIVINNEGVLEMISHLYDQFKSPSKASMTNSHYFYGYMVDNSDNKANAHDHGRVESDYVLITLLDKLLHCKYVPLLTHVYNLLISIIHNNAKSQEAVCTAVLLNHVHIHLQSYSMQLELIVKITMLVELFIHQNNDLCNNILSYKDGNILHLIQQYHSKRNLELYVQNGQEDLISIMMIHIFNAYTNINENKNLTIYRKLTIDVDYLKSMFSLMNSIGDKYILMVESFLHFMSSLLKLSLTMQDVPKIKNHVHMDEDSHTIWIRLLHVLHIDYKFVSYLLHVLTTLAFSSHNLFEYAVTCVTYFFARVEAFLSMDANNHHLEANRVESSKSVVDLELVASIVKAYVDLLSLDSYVSKDNYPVFRSVCQSIYQLLVFYAKYHNNGDINMSYKYFYDPNNSANPLDPQLLYYHFPYTKPLLFLLSQIISERFSTKAKYSEDVLFIYEHFLNILKLLVSNCSEIYIAVCRDIFTDVIKISNKLYLDQNISSHNKIKPIKGSDLIFQSVIAVASAVHFQYMNMNTSSGQLDGNKHENIVVLHHLSNHIAFITLHAFQDISLLSSFMTHSSNFFHMLIYCFSRCFPYNLLNNKHIRNTHHLACILQCLEHGPASLLNFQNFPLCNLFMQLVQFMYYYLYHVEHSFRDTLYLAYTYTLQALGIVCCHGVHIKTLIDDLHIEEILLNTLKEINMTREAIKNLGDDYQDASGIILPAEESKIVDNQYSFMSNNGEYTTSLHNSTSIVMSPYSKRPKKRVSFIDTNLSDLPSSPAAKKVENKPRLVFSNDQILTIAALLLKCLGNICHDDNFIYTASLVKGGLMKYTVQCLQVYGKESPAVTLACLDLCIHLAGDHKISLGELGACEVIGDVFCHYLPLIDIEDGLIDAESGFAIDQQLVDFLCKAIRNMCNSYAGNKKRFKEYEGGKILAVLQLLIGKYHMLINNPTRANVKDAINAIKFKY